MVGIVLRRLGTAVPQRRHRPAPRPTLCGAAVAPQGITTRRVCGASVYDSPPCNRRTDCAMISAFDGSTSRLRAINRSARCCGKGAVLVTREWSDLRPCGDLHGYAVCRRGTALTTGCAAMHRRR
jgi:hypothetical protein